MFRMYYNLSFSVGFYCPCVAVYVFKRQLHNPHLPIRDHLGMLAHANYTASPMRGSIYIAHPNMGGVGGVVYLLDLFVEHLPSQAAPWGRVIDDE